MFDRYEIRTGPQSVDVRSTVHEHRAPTDDSVRLLGEMERAAEKRVMSTVRLESNGFKFVVQRMCEPFKGDLVYRMMYELNGRRNFVEYVHNDWTPTDTVAGQQKVAQGLVECLSRDIAINLLAEGFKGGFQL